MAYNTTVHRTTGQTPSFLMFGFQPSLPGLIQPSYDESDNNTRLQVLQKARDAAHEHSTKQAVSYATSKDKSALQADFAPGQQVLLDVRLFPNQNQKLADKFEGPYYIVQIHPKNTCDILKNNKIHRVSFDRIKPYQVQIPLNVQDSFDTSQHVADQMLIPVTPPLIPSQEILTDINDDDNDVAPTDVDIPVPQTRKRGRPKKSDTAQVTTPPLEPVPYVGPTTRSRAKLNEVSHSQFSPSSVQTSISNFSTMLSDTVTDLFKRLLLNENLRMTIAQMLLKKLKELFPMLFHDVTVRPFRPKVPFRNNKHHSAHSRHVFLNQQDKATQEALLHHDPYFLVDPTIYHYAILRPENKGSQLGTPHIIKKESISPPPTEPAPEQEPSLATPVKKEEPPILPPPVPAVEEPLIVAPELDNVEPLVLPEPVPSRPHSPLFPFDPDIPDPFGTLPVRTDSLDSNATVVYHGEPPEDLGIMPCHQPVPFPRPRPTAPRPNVLYGIQGPPGTNPMLHHPVNRIYKRYASSETDPVDLIDPNADLSDPMNWQVPIRDIVNFENRRKAQLDPMFDFPEVPPPPKVNPEAQPAISRPAIIKAPILPSPNVFSDAHFAVPDQLPPAPSPPKTLPSMPPPCAKSQSLPAHLPVDTPAFALPLPSDDMSMPSLDSSDNLPPSPDSDDIGFQKLSLECPDISSSDDFGMPHLSLECPETRPPPRSLENPLPSSMSCAQPEYDNMDTNNPYFPGGWRPPPDATRDSTDSILDKIRKRP